MKHLLSLLVAFCLVLGTLASPQDYFNVTQARDTFVATYVHTTPLNDYVIGVSVSMLTVQKAFHNITLSHNENWSDFCLDVMLGIPLPQDFAMYLPSTFFDLRVFYRVAEKPPQAPTGEPWHACPMIVKFCPDGTPVGATWTGTQCEFLCPNASRPTGNLTWDQIIQVQKNFEAHYFKTAPYSTYITGVGISTLLMLNNSHTIHLEPQEKWADWCLSAYLTKRPPKDVQFPDVFQGARVVYEIGVTVCALSTDGCSERVENFDGFVVVFVVAIALFIALVVGICRVRRRMCKQSCKSGFQKVQEEQAQPQFTPQDYAVEMYYPAQREQPQYPMYVPMPPWLMPFPAQLQQQQQLEQEQQQQQQEQQM